MKFPRASGILLHPTSLPGQYGIGEIGEEAYRFIDYIADAGQKLWQVLSLGPTGYGDSPYQCFSAFAGNPFLISLDELVKDGLLNASDLATIPVFPEAYVDYGWVIDFKYRILRLAYERFQTNFSSGLPEEFQDFCRENAWWLEDFALFMTLKEAHGGALWTQWEKGLVRRDPNVLTEWRSRLHGEIEAKKFWQFLFYRQWNSLKTYCNQKGIQIIGDVPIYVAHDSADVWSHPELYQLSENGYPLVVAGVPPDYFSQTGQLWGNSIYRWDRLEKTGYSWWIDRFRQVLQLVDIVRLDHFRGFEAYWEVPAAEKTAVLGRWVKGPGASLFIALQNALGKLPIIAENLGVITSQVEALRHQFEFPGMAILQFAFGGDAQSIDLPHNYCSNLVAYTGTHDNDTTVGWWNSTGKGDSTRSLEQVEKEKAFTRDYLNTDGKDIHWVFIRTLMASVADTVIFPLQDVLGEESQARMNLPGRPSGNWQWRFSPGSLTPEIQERIKKLAIIYGRFIPEKKKK